MCEVFSFAENGLPELSTLSTKLSRAGKVRSPTCTLKRPRFGRKATKKSEASLPSKSKASSSWGLISTFAHIIFMGSVRYLCASCRVASSTFGSAPALNQRKQSWLSLGPQSPASYLCFDHSLKVAWGPACFLIAMVFMIQRWRTSFFIWKLKFSATLPISSNASNRMTPGTRTSYSRCSGVLKTPVLSHFGTTPSEARPLNSRLSAFHIGGAVLLSVKRSTAGPLASSSQRRS
mmetsp:Transcript_2125/g.8291  ORF Transcript_2125/g.8291 Transcript_2125/m.8291 type:complete len:234 (+) Transcript_2125:120-821(+)